MSFFSELMNQLTVSSPLSRIVTILKSEVDKYLLY